ncbi:hypothetical protein HanPI659440_Chr08g0298551 [Helianthus annuus]|nr:hypothetical protein HanPI659440_Chr08g0298551 [Helianthus annuus]
MMAIDWCFHVCCAKKVRSILVLFLFNFMLLLLIDYPLLLILLLVFSFFCSNLCACIYVADLICSLN